MHKEWFIKEYRSIGDICSCDQVPDNVLEHVMRAPHLDQVLCLLLGNSWPFPKIILRKVEEKLTPHLMFPMVEVTVGRPKVKLSDLMTSLFTPPWVMSSTRSGGLLVSIISSMIPHAKIDMYLFKLRHTWKGVWININIRPWNLAIIAEKWENEQWL